MIYIENRTNEADWVVIECIRGVIDQGKISSTRGIKHYCHHTVFNRGIAVSCILTRKNNIKFIVTLSPEK